MIQPLISVIVPVYKVEQYLERCVESILNQTYRNLEIILVDDGSPDRSGEMCDEFAKKDSRIRVFHKENGGQSSARNLALDHMTGDYVGFVDSDDWIEPDMYERLYDLLVSSDAQISCCGAQKDSDKGVCGYFNPNYPAETDVKEYETLEALRESFLNMRITYSTWDKLYQKEIWQNLRMTEGRIYEDMEIIPKCLVGAKKIVYLPQPLYHYRQTEESTIRGQFNLRRFAEVGVSRERIPFFEAISSELGLLAKLLHVEICLGNIYRSAFATECKQERNKLILEMREQVPWKLFRKLRSAIKFKYVLFRISVPLYVRFMDFYERLR